jgi:NAD-dependent dihydropyrimidine dehydrogenase PreA subunit
LIFKKDETMKIFILSSGEYGSRIVNNIAAHGFAANIVGIHEFYEDLPEFIDDISEYIPKNIPECDLLISVGLFGDVNLVIPTIALESKAKSIIVPIHNPKQIPAGLQSEIEGLIENANIIFPKPFCSLKPQGDEYIDQFTEVFGKPELEIQGETRLNEVKVLRGAPCGSTNYIAEKIVGIPLEEAEFEAGNKLHNYPCLASMNIDPLIGDTIMHLAGYKAKESVKTALGFALKSAIIDNEVCQGGIDCEHLCLEVCPNVKAGDHTIYIKEDQKAEIDPAACGACEICIKDCPYGAIEIFEEKIPCNRIIN